MTRLDGKNENLRFTNRGKYSKIAPGNEVLPWETKTAEIRLMTSVRKSQGHQLFFASIACDGPCEKKEEKLC